MGSSSESAGTTQSVMVPATSSERTLTQVDLGLIWFGAAISIGEIWAGGLPGLTSVGLFAGIVAIVLGRIVGNGLMALMARIGAETGLPTMVLARPAFGVRGSYIPALANVLQLIGWTGWMVFIAAEYVATLAKTIGAPWNHTYWLITALLVGILCTLWALSFAGQWWWKWVERSSSLLLLLLSIGMTVLVIQRTGLSGFPSGSGSGLGIFLGMDLVIAMSVSWLPLVADYSRYARKSPEGRLIDGGGRGTFWGYFIGGTWMYATGLLVALATHTDAPDQMVVQIMANRGLAWVILAVVLVLIATTTTTFLDIYSAAVSAQNLWPRVSTRAGTIWCGVLGTIFGLVLNANAYEPFLVAIGAIFLPAFTVVLAEHFFLSGRTVHVEALDQPGGRYWYKAGYNWTALFAWLVGFLVYDWAQGFPSLLTTYKGLVQLGHAIGINGVVVNPALKPFAYGASLPCIAATIAIYLILALPMRAIGRTVKSERAA